MKTETLAYAGAIIIILALIAAVVALLITRTLTLAQVGPFLNILILPLTAIAGLPIFKAALAAPSPEQSQQLQQLHSQSIQALASVAQPAPVQPVHSIVSKDWVVNAQGNLAPSPPDVQPAQVVQVPFPTSGTSAIPQMTVPLASLPRQ